MKLVCASVVLVVVCCVVLSGSEIKLEKGAIAGDRPVQCQA